MPPNATLVKECMYQLTLSNGYKKSTTGKVISITSVLLFLTIPVRPKGASGL